MMMPAQSLIPKGDVKLRDYDPDYHGDEDKESAAGKLIKLQEKMEVLQERLYAEGKQSRFILFEAMDAAGKDWTIEK